MDLLHSVAPGSQPLLGVLGGGVKGDAAQKLPGEGVEEYDGFVEGCEYEVGDYRVTAEGKLLRRVRGQRKRRDGEEPRGAGEGESEREAGKDGTLSREGLSGESFDHKPNSGFGLTSGTESTEIDETTLILPGFLKHIGSNFKNTLIVMPPMELWAPIQRLRQQHDPAYDRWMPHINMLWPFFDFDGHSQAMFALKKQLQTFEPFTLHFNGFKTFKKGVLYLEPTTEMGDTLGELHALYQEMRACFPELPKEDKPFTPHLTVGKGDPKKMQKMADEEPWVPMSFEVNEVYIATRKGHEDPFWITHIVPLGGKVKPGGKAR